MYAFNIQRQSGLVYALYEDGKRCARGCTLGDTGGAYPNGNICEDPSGSSSFKVVVEESKLCDAFNLAFCLCLSFGWQIGEFFL